MTADQLIRAAKVPHHIPEASFGLWQFTRVAVGTPLVQAILTRVTELTMHQDRGEVVMEDSDVELRRHLPILRHGTGRILISGLGLGCVVRGLLAKSEVEHIDVVEIDRQIIGHFGPEFADDPRVTIHLDDALVHEWPAETRWNFAWHDIHCAKEDCLAILHARLYARFMDRVGKQGWWGAGARIMRRELPHITLAA